MNTRLVTCFGGRRERGVVLVIAMILLVVLSLISVAAVRSASSTEIAANNARQQGLAMQAAEAALRYCETGAISFMKGTGTLQITPQAQPSSAAGTYTWQVLSNWDGAGSSATPGLRILTDAEVNSVTGANAKLYKRYPECMVQYQFNVPLDLNRVVVTARGFGPDVPAVDGSRTAPKGSEVWLQSFVRYTP